MKMIENLRELLDIALDREIVSRAFYTAGQKKTQDPGAVEMMKELAAEEEKHYEWIKSFRDTGIKPVELAAQGLPDLMISEYLVDPQISEGAGLQEVLITAMKREQYSIEFYTRMEMVIQLETGRQLCRRLVGAERNHKAKIEDLYERLFLKEN